MIKLKCHKTLSLENGKTTSKTLHCAKATVISAYFLQLKVSSCNKRNTNILLKNYNLCVVITAYIKPVGGMPAKYKTGTKNSTFMHTDQWIQLKDFQVVLLISP